MKNSTQKEDTKRPPLDATHFPTKTAGVCPFDGLPWKVEEILAAMDDGLLVALPRRVS